jgi:hypothetical protein
VAHAAAVSTAPVTIQVQGVAAGETVLISETVDARGQWTITLTLPSASATGGGTTSGAGPGDGPGDGAGDDQLAEGTITQVSGTGVSISTGSATLGFSVDPTAALTDDATGQLATFIGDPDISAFDGVNPDDQVDVSYHASAAGYVADAVDDQVWDN